MSAGDAYDHVGKIARNKEEKYESVQWTKVRPKEEGWYWMKRMVCTPNLETEITIQHIRIHAGKVYTTSNDLKLLEVSNDWEWAGPLKLPDRTFVWDIRKNYTKSR